MTLSETSLAIIAKYTDAYRIDREKLISYLEKHRTIKRDIFKYCTKVSKKSLMESRGYSMYLDDEPVFMPMDRDTFIRRIPFYFQGTGSGENRRSGLSYILPAPVRDYTADDYEEFYKDLEWMYYTLQIPVEYIFSYTRDQVSDGYTKPVSKGKGLHFSIPDSIFDKGGVSCRELFTRWRHYLHLCIELGWTDYMPDRLITAYNLALEAFGMKPIIYYPVTHFGSAFVRDENIITCKGQFPCDENGKPVLRWTSLRINKPADLEYPAHKSREATLTIKLGPATTIHALLPEDDESGFEVTPFEDEPAATGGNLSWYQIYAGPQTMFFDHEALKEFRVTRGMTQAEVADAIGASTRTYQKWESGATTPDCQNLLRLMNWLNIDNVQDLIKYDEPTNTEEDC